MNEDIEKMRQMLNEVEAFSKQAANDDSLIRAMLAGGQPSTEQQIKIDRIRELMRKIVPGYPQE